MDFNVPQFIEVEDKIVGPLTWKHIFWMIGMGAILLLLFKIFSFFVFVFFAIMIVPLFVALAFYRPFNEPLVRTVFSGFSFLFRPKIYTWKRLSTKRAPISLKKEVAPKKPSDVPVITLEEIQNIATTLDASNEERENAQFSIKK